MAGISRSPTSAGERMRQPGSAGMRGQPSPQLHRGDEPPRGDRSDRVLRGKRPWTGRLQPDQPRVRIDQRAAGGDIGAGGKRRQLGQPQL